MRIFVLKKGFTIVEMVFTLAVISILAGIIIGYSRRGESETNLIRAANQFILDIQRTQHLAMLIYEEQSVGGQKNCGWGIFFSQNRGDISSNPLTKYIVFSDFCGHNLTGNGIFDDGETYEERNLIKGVEIYFTNINSFVFIPPEPAIKFDPSSPLDEGGNIGAEIKFRLNSNPNRSISVFISPSGQIYKVANP